MTGRNSGNPDNRDYHTGFRCAAPPETYLIGGQVLDANSNPIPAVTISAGATYTTTTDASGYYTLTGFPTGVYTVTASHSNYSISPGNRIITLPPNATNVGFTGTLKTYSVSGQVTDESSNPISGVTLSAGAAYSTSTDISGNYTLIGLPNGIYTITAVQSGYAFTPTNHSIPVPPSATAQNFTRYPGLMVEIGAGIFTMGCDDANNAGVSCASSETPLHSANLDAYRIDKYEVTNSQYAQCVAGGACALPLSNSSFTRPSYYDNSAYANYPVIYVSWYNAHDYCAWAGKRLPSEAEWEKAARGPSGTQLFPWGDEPANCDRTNYNSCLGDTSAVGSYPSGASPTGALDMAGNVWEWVGDWYSNTYYSSLPPLASNPSGPITGTYKVLRGGVWYSDVDTLRVADRYYNNPTSRYYSLGFRCAAPPQRYVVRGEVVDSHGAPIAGATISAGGVYSTSTNSSGNYLIGGLPGGVYTVTASHKNYSFLPLSQTYAMPPNATNVVFTGTLKTYTVSGQVVDGSRIPISGATISAGTAYSTSTNISGTYTLSGLTSGPYTITASHSLYTFVPISRTITLPPDTASVVFTGTLKTFSISGQVVDGSSNPVSGVTISTTLTGSVYSTSTNISGSYTLSGLSAGTYTVTARQIGYFFTPINLHATVPPDATAQNFTRHNTPPPSGDLISIPSGDFNMGCYSLNNAGFACESDALPLHTVNLSSYRIDKYEVTNAQYALCVAAGACTLPSSISSSTHTSYYDNPTYASYPVIYVSWNNANNYCTWLGKRLPSEAEWEKAARGGPNDTRLYPWGNLTANCNLANFNSCVGDTNAVGSYSPGASPYGVLDMAGNVWEWVNDWYSSTYYSGSPGSNPPGPTTGTYKVLRGGAWNSNSFHLRLTYRNYSTPNGSYNFIGFRCAAPP